MMSADPEIEDPFKIFVGNLPFSLTQEQLQSYFEPHGPVSSVALINKRGRPAGYAFVSFETEEGAENAVAATNQKDLEGRIVNVQRARPRQERESRVKNEMNGDDSGFEKKRKPRSRKKKAPVDENGEPIADASEEKAAPRRRPKREPRVKFDEDGTPIGTPSSTNLFVANLPFSSTDESLAALFEQWGGVVSSRVVRLRSGRSKGFGFVELKPGMQSKCLAEWGEEGRDVEGRMVVVKVAMESQIPPAEGDVEAKPE